MLKKILIFGANFIYMFFKLLPTKNRVTLISRQSNQETTDFKLIREKFNEIYPEVEICVLCHKLENGIKAKIFDKVKYMFHCIKQMYYISTSKVVVLDSYCILASILNHKQNLKIIQMWHSMGTMKKFGYQILDLAEGSNKKLAEDMRMHKNYDYIFASSMEYAPFLLEGFGYDIDKARIFSLPRVDLLMSKEYKEKMRNIIQKKYPIIKEKENIVYCPTFRKNEDIMQKEIEKLVDSVDYEKYNLIIKLHPLSKIKIENDKAIIDRSFSSFDMLFIADYVISDYSCIIYEVAILNIPLYFWAFDLEKYLDSRGITIDYEQELPGIKSKNIDDIIKSIENDQYNYDELKKFKEKYISNTKNCTKKIVEFIEKVLNDEEA